MTLVRERIVKEDFELGYGTTTRTADNGGSLTGNKIGIHSLIDGFINVKDKGAKGDGSTDDTVAIQAALDSGERVVLFPKPTSYYRLTDNIQIPSNRLVLGNRSKVKLEAASSTGAAVFIYGTSNVQVDALEVDCLAGLLGESGIGIARSAANVVAEKIWLTNNYSHGFKTSVALAGGVGINCEVGGTDIHIIGNSVDDCSNGIWLGSSALYPLRDYEVIGNHISNIVNNQSNLRYSGNAFMIDDPGGAPAPSTNVHNGTISSNTINGAPVAFHTLYSGRVAIIGNTARLITQYGYFNQESHYNTFMNNTIQGTLVNYVKFLNDVNLYGAYHNIVAFNNFLGTASSNGILGDASASRCYFFLNKMQSPTGARISLAAPATENLVVDAEDAALTSLMEVMNGVSVPNNIAYWSKTSAGTANPVLKVDANDDTLLYRIGSPTAIGRIDNGSSGGLIWGATTAGDDTNLATGDIRGKGSIGIIDGMTAPTPTAGYATIYVDSADGDLKVAFGDAVVKTLATDT